MEQQPEGEAATGTLRRSGRPKKRPRTWESDQEEEEEEEEEEEDPDRRGGAGQQQQQRRQPLGGGVTEGVDNGSEDEGDDDDEDEDDEEEDEGDSDEEEEEEVSGESDQEGRSSRASDTSKQPSKRQHQPGRQTRPSHRVVTNPKITVDYAALTREYEQRGEASTPFPQYADTIMQLTQKANRRQRKSRKKVRAEGEEEPRKKKKRRGARTLNHQQQELLGEAQTLYMKGQLREALDSVSRLLALKHYTAEVASLRSQISEELGYREAAAEWGLVASRLGKNDAALWKKAGQLYLELGPPGYYKAQYCFGRAVKLNKDDYEALADRAQVFSMDNNVDRAVQYYEQLMKINPPNPEVFLVRMAEDCFREKKFWARGTQHVYNVLCRSFGTAFMSKQTKAFPSKHSNAEKFKPSKNLLHAYDAASVFCRHLMAPYLKKYEQAAAVIEVCQEFVDKLRNQEQRFQTQEGADSPSLPLDLAVQYGICKLHMDEMEPALRCFKALQEQDPDQPAVVGLIEDVAAAYTAKDMHFRAFNVLRRVNVDGTRLERMLMPINDHVMPLQGGGGPDMMMHMGGGAPPPPPSTQYRMREIEHYVRFHSVNTAMRLRLKIARSYYAAKKYEQAEEMAQEVLRCCQQEPNQQAAFTEATVVRSMVTRKLQKRGQPLQDCLASVTHLVRDMVFRLPPPLPQHQPPPPPMQQQQPPPPAPPQETRAPGQPLIYVEEQQPPPPPPEEQQQEALQVDMEDDALLRAMRDPTERMGTGGNSNPVNPKTGRPRKKRWKTLSLGFADEPTSVSHDIVELELILEFGLLSRELNRLEDFFTACLVLIELAVFQSKNKFRETNKPVDVETDAALPAGEAPPSREHIHDILTRSWDRTPLQQDIEHFVRVRAYTHTVKLLLGEDRLYEAIKAIVDTCVAAGMSKEANMVIRQVSKRKKLLTESHLRELIPFSLSASVSAAAGGGGGGGGGGGSAATTATVQAQRNIFTDDIHGSIRNALTNAHSHPHDVELLNNLCRLLHQVRPLESSTRLYIRRLAAAHTSSVPLNLLAAHNFAGSRNFKVALDKYLAALRLSAGESIAALSAAVLLLRVLCHKKMIDRHGCIIKALAFLEKYALTRKEEDPLAGQADHEHMSAGIRLALHQEVAYNTGRAFHQAGLLHMAVQYYSDALAMYDEEKECFESLGAKAHVTREAAHNLALIYRESGNRDKAAWLATKYLTVV